MYVRHKTVEASEALVEEVDMMVDTMKDAFSENLKKLTWMTENSQNAAQEKLSGMMDLIGYPEQVLNSTWLNKKYSEVEVTKDYLMNIIAFQSHQRKEGMKLYTKYNSIQEYIVHLMPNVILDHMNEDPGLRCLTGETL